MVLFHRCLDRLRYRVLAPNRTANQHTTFLQLLLNPGIGRQGYRPIVSYDTPGLVPDAMAADTGIGQLGRPLRFSSR